MAPAWGVGDVVSGTDPTDQPLTSSVTALGGTQKKLTLALFLRKDQVKDFLASTFELRW